MVVPAAVAISSDNPIGLIVLGGLKIYGEAKRPARTRSSAAPTRPPTQFSEQLKI
jgi:hypothetical protein